VRFNEEPKEEYDEWLGGKPVQREPASYQELIFENNARTDLDRACGKVQQAQMLNQMSCRAKGSDLSPGVLRKATNR
jgi:predicted TPR repeat methyltransferase